MQPKAMRHSKQRERIYDYLMNTTAHPSAEMVYEDLKKEMPALSLGTVYRNLKLLEELGKLQRVVTHNNIERYDARIDDHAHFVCECCSKVFDLDRIHREKIKKSCGLDDSVDISWMKVTFGGVCTSCKRKTAYA